MKPPFLYSLSPRTVLRLSGADRVRYLNGQVSQDVRSATRDQAAYSCVLNTKGQIDAVCHIREHDDSYLIDAPLDLREKLSARLDRYIIADDVALHDESDDWHVAHLYGLDQPPPGLEWWTCTRLDRPGLDLFSRTPIAVDAATVLQSADLDDFRTRLGLPNWGAEITPGMLPPEVGLEEVAISYDKGCYLGQEVISRMKRAGKTNRILISLEVAPQTVPPCKLVHDGVEVGRLTSVAHPPGARPRDLAEGAEEGQAQVAAAVGLLRSKFAHLLQNKNGATFDLRDLEDNLLPGNAGLVPSRPG